MNVFEAIRSRRSIRAFLPRAVPRRLVEKILRVARYAPSGSNIQPWKVWVVAGATRDVLVKKIMVAHNNDEPGYEDEYPYYPSEWFEPLLARRRALGKALYTVTEVAKGDLTAMKRQQGRNFEFFGAPVGLFITVDKRSGLGAYIDAGAYIQSIMVAARGFGLHTCPQQSFSKYHLIIRKQLAIPDNQLIICGMSLGFEDSRAAVSKLRAAREPLAAIATFLWD